MGSRDFLKPAEYNVIKTVLPLKYIFVCESNSINRLFGASFTQFCRLAPAVQEVIYKHITGEFRGKMNRFEIYGDEKGREYLLILAFCSDPWGTIECLGKYFVGRLEFVDDVELVSNAMLQKLQRESEARWSMKTMTGSQKIAWWQWCLGAAALMAITAKVFFGSILMYHLRTVDLNLAIIILMLWLIAGLFGGLIGIIMPIFQTAGSWLSFQEKRKSARSLLDAYFKTILQGIPAD